MGIFTFICTLLKADYLPTYVEDFVWTEDLILLKTLKDDIKIADIINKIKYRIFEKLHNISKNNRESNSRFNYSVFINDMRHYQVLKINKKIINNYREVSDFLSPKNNFTFSQKSIRSSSNK